MYSNTWVPIHDLFFYIYWEGHVTICSRNFNPYDRNFNPYDRTHNYLFTKFRPLFRPLMKFYPCATFIYVGGNSTSNMTVENSA